MNIILLVMRTGDRSLISKAALSSLGSIESVHIADDAWALAQQLQNDGKSVDLVIIDDDLGTRADGLSLATLFRTKRPGLPIILCATMTPMIKAFAERNTINAVIEKSWNPDKLVLLAKALLQSSDPD